MNKIVVKLNNKSVVRGFSLVRGKHDPEGSHYEVENLG